MTTKLIDGLISVNIQGNFGWTGMPFAFEVVTRVMRVVLKAELKGNSRMLTDDIICVFLLEDIQHDPPKIAQLIVDLLGSKGEAIEKRESTHTNEGRKIVVFGWILNLNDWTIDVAHHNLMKALYTFWNVDLDVGITLDRAQALCSMAQRYAMIFREMGVLMADLYCLLGGSWYKRHHTISIPSRTKAAIRLWRAVLSLNFKTLLNLLPKIAAAP